MSPFLLKNTQFDVFARLFCWELSEIVKTETKIVATARKFLHQLLVICVPVNKLNLH